MLGEVSPSLGINVHVKQKKLDEESGRISVSRGVDSGGREAEESLVSDVRLAWQALPTHYHMVFLMRVCVSGSICPTFTHPDIEG